MQRPGGFWNASGGSLGWPFKALGGPQFPVVESRSSGVDASNLSSHPITLPTGIQAGDLIIILFGMPGIPTISIGSGTGWTLDSQVTGSGSSTKGAYFWKIADGNDALTVATTTSERAAHVGLRISGAGTVYDASAAPITTANPNPPNLAPGVGSKKFLWLAGVTTSTEVTVSAAPTNYTDLHAISGISASSAGVGQRNLEAASEDPGTFTLSGASNTVVWTLAVAPA